MFSKSQEPEDSGRHISLHQLSALRELYLSSLESHTIRVVNILTQEPSRRAEALTIRVRELAKRTLKPEDDEVLALLAHRMASGEESKLVASLTKSNRELQAENGRLKTSLDERSNGLGASNSAAVAQIEDVTDFFSKQLQHVEKQLYARENSEKDLRKELEGLRLDLDDRSRKVKELEDTISHSKKDKSALMAELKSLNELIKRFETENTELIRKNSEERQ